MIKTYVETNDYKSFIQTKNKFIDSLVLCGRVLDYYESREVITDITVDNYHTQSIGNRKNRWRCHTRAKFGNKYNEVFLPAGFAIAREGLGYNFDDKVIHAKDACGDIWEIVQKNLFDTTDWTFPNESIAWIGYFFSQLITGQLTSSESSIKTDMLNTMIVYLKPSVLDITIYPRTIGDDITYQYKKNNILGLIESNIPRLVPIHATPIRKKIKAKGGKARRNIGKKII